MLLGAGDAFNDTSHPRPVVQVGNDGDVGALMISDVIFSTRAPAAGAIIVQWNVREAYQGAVGIFDAHIRVGGLCVSMSGCC